jgi:hypothetical protein
MTRLHTAAAAAALACAFASVTAAQSVTTERHEKTKIEVKGGKRVTLRGCLERVGNNSGYILTDADGGLKYALVTEDDLSKYLTQRVEVTGNAADRGDGKVKIEHRVEGTSGVESASKTEERGDAAVLPFLGLKSIKSIGGSCE